MQKRLSKSRSNPRNKQKPKKYLTSYTLLFLCLIAIVFTFILSRQQQQLGQQAATSTCQSLPLKIPVLVLGYFPADPNNPTMIDPTETGWTTQRYAQYGVSQPLTLTQWHTAADTMTAGMIPEITDNTRYHGYKDPNAMPFLTWTVADKKYFDTVIPHGVRDSEPGNPYRPDYHKILTDQNICDYVDNKGVKEVWIYGYHSDIVSPDESRMSSKYGDISNSFPNGTNVDSTLILPVCKNSYVLYNFETLPKGDFANSVHDRMHQIERTMTYADNENYDPSPNGTGLFWGNFAQGTGDSQISCGWAHNPPNTTTQYDYSNKTSVSSNCENWNPDHSLSTYGPVTCDNWGCTDQKFYKWWMQNNPGYNNGLTYQGKPMRNWWEAMYDFNAFINQNRSLVGNSLFSCFVTPTATAGANFNTSSTQSTITTSPCSQNITVTPTPSVKTICITQTPKTGHGYHIASTSAQQCITVTVTPKKESKKDDDDKKKKKDDDKDKKNDHDDDDKKKDHLPAQGVTSLLQKLLLNIQFALHGSSPTTTPCVTTTPAPSEKITQPVSITPATTNASITPSADSSSNSSSSSDSSDSSDDGN